MANSHAEAFRKIKGCQVVAACDVDRARVEAFGVKHGIKHTFSDVEELLATPGLTAVSNVTPDSFHAPITLQALRHGLHVLCEKPLATNYPDAKKMAQAARRAQVIHLVQFSYRASSALQAARKLVASGALGTVIHFEASYLQSWLSSKIWGDWRTTPAWLWRQSSRHGSKGVLGDVGVHVLDFATFVTGDIKKLNCQLKSFNDIKGLKKSGYTLDANDSAVVRCELRNGALGVVHMTRWATGQVNSLRLRVYCEKGAVEVDLDKSYHEYRVCRGANVDKAQWQTVVCKPTPTNFERFIRSIETKVQDQPDFDRGAAIQKVLDACFVSDSSGKTISV